MRKHLIVTAVAALVLGGEALADGFNYNYAQGNVLGTRMRGGGDSTDGSGLAFEGSIEFGPHLLGFADLGSVKYDEDQLSLRFNTVSLGLGGYMPLSPTVDLVGGASFESVELKASDGFDNGSESFHGWGLRAGVRGRGGDKFQWTAGLKYRDVRDLQSTVSVTIGGRYYFTPRFALGLDLTGSKYDKDTLDTRESVAALTFRYEFGGHR